jgi:hypothetical protein
MGRTIEVLGFDSRRGLEIFLVTTASRTALGPTQPSIQWEPGALSLGVKQPEREAGHSTPSSAEVKSAWSYTSTPQYVFMAWCLAKHRDNFYGGYTVRNIGGVGRGLFQSILSTLNWKLWKSRTTTDIDTIQNMDLKNVIKVH